MTTTYLEWRRHRACARKKAWQSEMLARNFAIARSWLYPDEPIQTPYRCEWCHEWHLTKLPLGRPENNEREPK